MMLKNRSMMEDMPMMRKIAAALAVLALVVVSHSARAADLKVGVVDLQKALNGTREGEDVKEVLKQKFSMKQDHIDAKKKEVKDIEEKLKSTVLSKEAKTVLQKDKDIKLEELREFVGRAQAEMEKENQTASQKIMDGLIEISRKIAKDEGFTFILEKNASGLVFYQDALDLTDRILRIYNEQNPGGSGKKP